MTEEWKVGDLVVAARYRQSFDVPGYYKCGEVVRVGKRDLTLSDGTRKNMQYATRWSSEHQDANALYSAWVVAARQRQKIVDLLRKSLPHDVTKLSLFTSAATAFLNSVAQDLEGEKK
jgi:hypothetical protein